MMLTDTCQVCGIGSFSNGDEKCNNFMCGASDPNPESRKNEIVYPISKTENFIVKNLIFWAGFTLGSVFGIIATAFCLPG